jgi:MFS family permease
MSLLAFARRNPRPLLFGALHSFYSAPGQTYVIGLFVAAIASTLGIGAAEIGALYLAATLSSAGTIVFVGYWIDHIRLVHFSAAVVVGITIACFVTALATEPFTLFIAFYLLRLTGQGLMTHVEATATARTFSAERGRALSITALGIPLSEIVFPPLAIAGIAAIGWQATYAGMGAIALLVILPLTQWLLRTFKRAPPGMTKPEGERRNMIAGLAMLARSRYMWTILPALAIFPFHMTGIMFHITTIAAAKGWSIGVVAASYPVMAVTSVFGLFLSGQLIDRITARRLLPFVYLPLLAGVALLASYDSLWAMPIALGLMGFGGGMSRTTLTAIWAEVFGVASLGTIRSAAIMFMVVMSGLSPFVLGLAFDAGLGVSTTLWSMTIVGVIFLVPAMTTTRQ